MTEEPSAPVDVPLTEEPSAPEDVPLAEEPSAPGDVPVAEEPSGSWDIPLSEDPAYNQELSLVDTLPGLARLAADVWWRGTLWGVGASMRVGSRLARAAVDPGAAAELVQDFGSGMRNYAREFLGVSDLDNAMRQLAPTATTLSRRGRRNGHEPEQLSLRAQGAELLRQAADVGADDATHPAYAHILSELTPDEARILRLLDTEGPQPLVDVRSTNLIGVGSQLVAPNLNMIGAQSGVRHRDKVPSYLNNLQRLGLIVFSQQPLADPIVYQVLEAQPNVLQSIKQTSRAKSVRRSIHLTPFGSDFCEAVLPRDTDEIEALPASGD